jgi:tRNA C32,U32 (ribose-2'-O)-methylase TrmJ
MLPPGKESKIMLKFITWGNYITGLGILLAGYYAVILIAFYRNEIEQLIKGAGSKQFANPATADEIESLVKEIDAILEQAGKTATKEQLLPQLKHVLAGYYGLLLPAYEAAVYNHILKKADEVCGLRLSSKDLGG